MWRNISKMAGKWAINNASTWVPAAKKSATDSKEGLLNREKAIRQAGQVGGQFAGIYLGSSRYWVVRKDGHLLNAFPNFQDKQSLEEAARHLREDAWGTPDKLLRQTARQRATKLRPRRNQHRGDTPQS
jgi:hypothetical protein